MDKDALHAERISHPACMLPAGAAETGERVAGNVVPPRNGNLADCGGHILYGDGEKAFRNLFEPFRSAQLVRDLLEPRARGRRIEGSITFRTEYGWKLSRVDPTKK
jgi:hypothetical protein